LAIIIATGGPDADSANRSCPSRSDAAPRGFQFPFDRCFIRVSRAAASANDYW